MSLPLLIGLSSLEAVFGSHVGKKDEENSAFTAVAVVAACCCFALTFLGSIEFSRVDFELTVSLF